MAMKSSLNVQMHAIAFLYGHLGEFPVWIRRLKPGQLEHIAQVMMTWLGTRAQTEEIVPLEELEKREIIRAMTVYQGDMLKAARALGIGRTTLYRRMKEWGYSLENQATFHQASALAEITSANTEPDRQGL